MHTKTGASNISNLCISPFTNSKAVEDVYLFGLFYVQEQLLFVFLGYTLAWSFLHVVGASLFKQSCAFVWLISQYSQPMAEDYMSLLYNIQFRCHRTTLLVNKPLFYFRCHCCFFFSRRVDEQEHCCYEYRLTFHLLSDINQKGIVEEGGLDALLMLFRSSENTTIL